MSSEPHVLIIHPERCTGCRICEQGCSLAHTGECNPDRSRIRVVREENDGQLAFFPSTCMGCDTPPCMTVCPTGAMGTDARTGARMVDGGRCIGCSACAYACPFGACFVDRRQGRAAVCDHCGGDPICARLCPTEALEYVRADKAAAWLRRTGVQRTAAVEDRPCCDENEAS